MRFDDDIWGSIRQHGWKYRRRTAVPTLIELHATRSGIVGRTAQNEYDSTVNWFKSRGNLVVVGSPDDLMLRGAAAEAGDDWASMASYIVGGGKVCRVMPEDIYPHYSLGHADHLAFSVEIGQNLKGTPFEPGDLELAAELCAELSQAHSIPVRVLDFLSADNHEAPGYVRHDRSANGRYWGKSDPGPEFDDRHFEALVRSYLEEEEDDDMAALALMSVAGTFQFLASDFVQGYAPNQTICNEILSLIGDGPIEQVLTGTHAYGLMLYAGAEALRGKTLRDSIIRLIRYLVRERPHFTGA